LRYIFKFGGSSLSTPEKIKKIASFIKQTKKREDLQLVVVVSAMGKTTNKLISLADELKGKSVTSNYSSLITIGENISTYCLSLALEAVNIPNICLTAKDIKLYAKGDPTQGIITHIDKNIIEKHLYENKVVIIPGFQGVNDNNEIITLGRGGSDTTAVALGSALDANVKIFTDVKGFHSLDPNNYKNPKLLKIVNIYSALELSNAGAKVLDNRCLTIANKNKTNLQVCESMKNNGSSIEFSQLENYKVDGISTKNNLLIVKKLANKQYFLQNIIQKCNFNTYFYEINNNEEILVTDTEKKTIDSIFKVNNIKKTKLINCELLVLCGSGLTFHKDFLEKVQKTIKNNKIYTYYTHLSPTYLKIITKRNQSKQLEQLLAKAFNLYKER